MTQKHIHLETIDSTNNFLQHYKEEHPTEDITLVTANYQTGGRGQRGNSWESEEGKNVVYSLLVHPQNVRPSQIFSLSEVAALSICEGLDAYLSPEKRCEVKWPNDIYFGEKKICGILIETDLMSSRIANAIIGVGVNVNQRDFKSDAPNPISLYQITGEEHPVDEVLAHIMTCFETLYTMMQNGQLDAIHQRYMNRLYRRSGMHKFTDEYGDFCAHVAAVEATGHLILEDTDGKQRRYAFKEVSWCAE